MSTKQAPHLFPTRVRRISWCYRNAEVNLREHFRAQGRLIIEMQREPQGVRATRDRFLRRLGRLPRSMVCPTCKECVPEPIRWSSKRGVCRRCAYVRWVESKYHKTCVVTPEYVATFIKPIEGSAKLELDGVALGRTRRFTGYGLRPFSRLCGWGPIRQAQIERGTSRVQAKTAARIRQAFATITGRRTTT